MWNIINNAGNLVYRIETDSQISKAILWLPKGKLWVGGGLYCKDWINTYTRLYIVYQLYSNTNFF